jgi:Tfp pilus assembly PilM family ATPase
MGLKSLINAAALPARSPIGIDVGRRAVKAVQLERVSGAAASSTSHDLTGWRVAAAAVLPRAESATGETPSAAEVRQLADALERKSFAGADVVLAAPEGLLCSVLELPPLSAGAPVGQIARIELARTHKCAPDSFEMGYWELPTLARAQKATSVMAVALPHAVCDPLIDRFDQERLNVCGVDVRSCAVARACAGLGGDAGFNAVVDIGARSAELVLLFQGAVIYTRSLAEAGMDPLRDAIAARLKLEREVAEFLLSRVGLAEQPGGGTVAVESEDAADTEMPSEARTMITGHFDGIAQELAASFSYAVHQYRDAAVSRLLMVGGGAAVPGAAAYLTRATGIEAVVASPAALCAFDPALAELCPSPALTAALGLAMYPPL